MLSIFSSSSISFLIFLYIYLLLSFSSSIFFCFRASSIFLSSLNNPSLVSVFWLNCYNSSERFYSFYFFNKSLYASNLAFLSSTSFLLGPFNAFYFASSNFFSASILFNSNSSFIVKLLFWFSFSCFYRASFIISYSFKLDISLITSFF